MRLPADMMRRGVAAFLLVGVAGFSGSSPVLADETSFGKDIPLSSAAKMIVPDGYKVEFGSGVDASKQVSWGQSNNWRKALSSAAASGGFTASVSGQTVKINAKGEKTEKAGSTDPLALPADPADSAKAEDKLSKAPKAMVADAAPDADAVPAHRRTQKVAKIAKAEVAEDEAPSSRRAAWKPIRRAEPVHRPRHRRVDVAETEVDGAAAVGADTVSSSGFVMMPEHVAKPIRSVEADADRSVVDAPVPASHPAPVAAGHQAIAGQNLHDVISQWAAADGWRVEWKSGYTYTLKTSAKYQGDFVAATTELVRTMMDSRPQPTAEFWRGNKVLVIDNKSRDEAAASAY